MKLLTFIAGIIAGIVGVNLYGIFVKPTLPSEDVDYDKLAEDLGNTLWQSHTLALGEALKVLDPPNIRKLAAALGVSPSEL